MQILGIRSKQRIPKLEGLSFRSSSVKNLAIISKPRVVVGREGLTDAGKDESLSYL
jgi:hypothetical protein